MPPEYFDCPSPVHPRPGDSLEAPVEAGQGVGAHPHDREVLSDGWPRSFIAGGNTCPGVVLAKGAGPGVYNRWSVACTGRRVLCGRVALGYLA